MASLVKHIVLGLLFDETGNLLIAKRQDYDNLWEIPGGKIESDETPQQAIIRELEEELGIAVLQLVALEGFSHDYDGVCFHFSVFHILQYRGQVHGAEGQLIQWVAKDQLQNFPFPPANKKLFKIITHVMTV